MRSCFSPLRRPRPARTVLAGTALLCVVACVTVNNYFPTAEVKKAAEAIVENAPAGGRDNPKIEKAGIWGAYQ